MLVERLLDAGADINSRTVLVGRMPPPGKDNFLYRERAIEILNQSLGGRQLLALNRTAAILAIA